MHDLDSEQQGLVYIEVRNSQNFVQGRGTGTDAPLKCDGLQILQQFARSLPRLR